MPISLVRIYRYPVKGLTPEELSTVTLTSGLGLPHDRRFALARSETEFDVTAPSWMPKSRFLMLMRNERLAKLRTRFDEATGILTIARDGKIAISANILEEAGRTRIEDFFVGFMDTEIGGRPRLLEAPGHMFSDVARKVVSIIGLPSIRDLERTLGRAVDPRRFRANFYIQGSRPWEEFDWVDREFSIGTVRLRGVKPISRCAATNVDPQSGERDLNITLALKQGFQHVNTGIYADVIAGGDVSVGDELVPPR